MGTKKLTLSAPEEAIADAKRIAAKNKTSVSAMFTRFLDGVSHSDQSEQIPIGPVTQKASGIVSLPSGSDRRLLEDALADKYGVEKA